MKSYSKKSMVFALALSLLLVFQVFAQQNLPFVRVSPKAKVVQELSFAKVKIEYSRPGQKGREIYGELVPYGLAPNGFGNGKPMPWRAGANENTTIYLSHDANVNGNMLPAGKYGIHMLVYEEEWTIIFSKDYQAWGSFFYEEKNDALRIKVKPMNAPQQEWLMYGFENLSANSADVFMHWGTKKVSFKIEVDNHKIVLDRYRTELTERAGFNQAAFGAAARYCMQNKINLDEAMTWVDKALSMNNGNTFTNNSIKAGLLNIQGKKAEGEKLLEASMGNATEAELNNYGYQLMGQDRLDDAVKIFTMNVNRHPDSWNTYDSLGEALGQKGDKKAARKNYEKAYDMAPANQKARIEGALKALK